MFENDDIKHYTIILLHAGRPLLSLSSLLSFTQLMLGNPLPFAFKYTRSTF